MKSRFLVLIALTGLFGSSIAIAQDGLGKKGNSGKSSGSSSQGRSSGGSSQGRSTPPARGGSSNSGGYRTTPPTQGNGRSSGQVGGSSGGYRTSPPTQGNGRSSGQVGGSTGGYRTTPPTQGNGRSSGQVGGSTGGYRTSPPTQGNGRSSGYNTAPPSRGGIGDGRSGSGSVIGSGKGYSYTPPQDDPLGKKGGNKGGGGSGGSGGGKGGGGGTGGVRTDPGPGRGSAGSGGSGGSGGGSVDLGKVIGGRSGGGGNRGGGEVPLGRPDRIGSRSGNVGYGSDHNLGRGNGKGITIGDMPVVGSNKKIEREVSRENRVRVGDSRYRSGYWNNNRGWCDDNFYYPYYGFQYYDGCNYVPSPFYYYYHLPGYISCNRITIGFLSWTSCNTRYDWNRPSYDRYQSDYDRRADFDYAVDDIERSFESGSIRQLALLIPARGRIEIDVDGRNQYSLSSDDFYDMMRDLVEGTGTTSYRIQNVYRDGDRGSIEAIHEYEDAWGRNQCVRHTFGLKLGRRGYEIVYFKSCQA